jgi:glycosyltransferase involved in cell wall biosynthesis
LVANHPAQYASPQFRLYSNDPRLDVTVAYCSLAGAEESHDPDFGASFAWDVPLLDGYRWTLMSDRPPRTGLGRMSRSVNTSLWSMIRRDRFDLVISYIGYRSASAWTAIASAKLRRIPLVLTISAHEARSLDGRSWKIPLKRTLLPIIYGLADGVFASSTRAKSHVSHMGVQAPSFFRERAGTANRVVKRRSWGIPEGALVALFVGKLTRWKRPGDLLDAIARLPNTWAVMAGSGVLRGELERKALQLGVSQRVRFLGFVQQTEMPEVLQAADVLVLPSEYETWGMVVNEAFAVGSPAVVSSACGSAGDLVIDGRTGFTFAPGDVGSLAEALARLDRDRELLARLGAAARERLDSWGPEQNRDAVVRAAQELAAG